MYDKMFHVTNGLRREPALYDNVYYWSINESTEICRKNMHVVLHKSKVQLKYIIAIPTFYIYIEQIQNWYR